MIVVILIILLIIGIFIIAYLSKTKKNQKNEFDNTIKNQQTKYTNEINNQMYQVQQWQGNYNTLYNKIEEEKEVKKEIEKRRRVSSKDKANVFERDNKTCQICGISYDFVENLCTGLGDYILFEIDHIQSVSQGGSGAEEDNLQCLCWRCNRKKGGKKTNEDVKAKIDYGITKLNPKYNNI